MKAVHWGLKTLVLFLFALQIPLLFAPNTVYAETPISSVKGTATVLNTSGEILFNSVTYGSNVSISGPSPVANNRRTLMGYAWSDDLGWIRFAKGEENEGVFMNYYTGNVTGSAYVMNTDGLIDFTNFNSNTTVNTVTGVFSGYVWSEDVGWIHFDNVYIDKYTPPTGSILVNLGADSTAVRNVTLTISATDTGSGLSSMMICNTPSFEGCIWEEYGTSRSWQLTEGDGIKFIYVRFRNNLGLISSTVVGSISLVTPVVEAPLPPSPAPVVSTDLPQAVTKRADRDIAPGIVIRNVEKRLEVSLLISENQVVKDSTKKVRVKEADLVVVDIPIQEDDDHDWSNAVIQVSVEEKKTVVKMNLEGGVLKPFTMYVPRGPVDNKFLLCTEASSLEELYIGCDSGIEFIGPFPQKEEVKGQEVSISAAIIDGRDYWIADGLVGTGGLSFMEDIEEEIVEREDTVSKETEPFSLVKEPLYILLFVLLVLIMVLILTKRRRR